jgi:mannose-6-phosphate isomerase
MEPQLYRLACGVQHYAWGERRHGEASPFIADLLGSSAGDGRPFAELWVGAHPSLPSRVCLPDGSRVPLDQFIAAHPAAVLGKRAPGKRAGALPFLLKVLSCEQALSIQAHPDRETAVRLHAADPAHYPDPNPKPEVAIAITPFTALCGFRRVAEILADVQESPALGRFFAAVPATRSPRAWLQAAYRFLFLAPAAQVALARDALVQEIRASPSRTLRAGWFLELAEHYPRDRGPLSLYFLELLQLLPGEAVFIGAGVPHAYLRGAIIECMGNSDNVVRAGLTPKHVDTDVLLSLLAYRENGARRLRPRCPRPGVWQYVPPVPEFKVVRHIGQTGDRRRLAAHDRASLLLVLRGQVCLRTPGGTITVAKGNTVLWPAAVTSVALEFLAPESELVRACPNQ